MLHKKLNRNTDGRDFIFGDIHGTFDLVLDAIKAVQFEPSTDRCIFLGDLISRGKYSRAVLSFLRQPWAESLRGNHEQMFLDIYANGFDRYAFEHHVEKNGFEWIKTLTPAEIDEHVAVFQQLPLAITLDTHRGSVGLVHAEVPLGMSWPDFVNNLNARDPRTCFCAIWSRSRALTENNSGVKGVDRIFSGHTIHNQVQQLGNCFIIDTGAYAHGNQKNHLTMVDVCVKTELMQNPEPVNSPLNLLVATSQKPFSQYLTK